MQNEIKNKDSSFKITKYIFFFLLFWLFGAAKLFGFLAPFAPALFFAFAWCGQNTFLLSLVYFASALFFGLNWINLLPVLFSIFLSIIFALIHRKIQKKVTLGLLLTYFLLSQMGRFIIFTSRLNFLIEIGEVLLGLLSLVCFVCFFTAFLKRKARIKLNTDEVVCGFVFLFAIACGLINIKFLGLNLGFYFAFFIALVYMTIFGPAKGILFSSVLSAGFFAADAQLGFVCALLLLSLLSAIFVSTNKYLTALSFILFESVLGFYFEIYGAYNYANFLAIVFFAAIYLLISKKTFAMLKKVFTIDKDFAGETFFANILGKMQSLKLNRISQVFFEMDLAYKNMLKKTLTKQEGCFVLAQELASRLCGDCPNKKVCFRKSGEDMLNHFYRMFSVGLEKKQVGVASLPSEISLKCEKTKVLINTANNLLAQYLQYDEMLCGINTSRLLISDQMGSVSKVIKELANDYQKKFEVDEELGKRVMQSLIYENITSISGVIATKSEKEVYFVVTSLNEIKNQDQLVKTIEKICKLRFEIKQSCIDEATKSVSYFISQAPKCDLVYGVASASKNQGLISGDTHTFVKIDTGKYLFGICDGIGSGKGASELSSATIGLVENYYKAGFETSSIAQNVNELFMAGNEEKFSALDVCVVDLFSLQADFIKLGAPNAYIKSSSETKIVEGGALPIGVLQEAKPRYQSKFLSPKDLIFLVSDGVSDCFENDEELKNTIMGLSGTNPQTLADELLEKALAKKEFSRDDDMTVFVSRVFNKV